MSRLAAALFEVAGLGGVLVGAVWDLWVRLIPNELVLWVALAGVLARLISTGWGAGFSLVIAIAALVGFGLLSGRGLMGGGDAKMIAAVSLLVAPTLVPALFVAIAAAGGLLALITLLLSLPAWRTVDWRELLRRPTLPFGVAIAAGAAHTVLRGLL